VPVKRQSAFTGSAEIRSIQMILADEIREHSCGRAEAWIRDNER